MNVLQQGIEVPVAVYIIWIATLAVAILVVLPIVVLLLQRTLNAARHIERYLTEMRDAGQGIADNTSHISALDNTVDVAGQILQTAGSIKEHSATIKNTLSARADAGHGAPGN